MTDAAWKAFRSARDRYRAYVEDLAASLPELRAAQQALVDGREGGSFAVETPVVYNGALDDVGKADEIKLILVADNPGRREQAAENRRYLVGPSGKLADGFFRSHPELGVDFRKNVIILNKTPIHTPRTAELASLARDGGAAVAAAIRGSQAVMASLILAFHRGLSAGAGGLPLWIIGYSELGRGKIFEPFAAAFEAAYGAADAARLRPSVLLFRHFSMNQFSVDLRKRAADGEALAETLDRVGAEYRRRYFSW
jgi:hypothetical protein